MVKTRLEITVFNTGRFIIARKAYQKLCWAKDKQQITDRLLTDSQ